MIRFTKEEKTILLFLVSVFFIGTSVLYLKKESPAFFKRIEFTEVRTEHPVKININKAAVQELVKIKGIGPVTASRIIFHREEHGPFLDREELKKVKGIGDATYEKIKESVVLE